MAVYLAISQLFSIKEWPDLGDVIEVIFYILGPVEYYRRNHVIFAVLDESLNNGP